MQKTVFSKSSIERKDEYKMITRIYEENGTRMVEKEAIGEAAYQHVEAMEEFALSSPYLTENVRLIPCEKVAPGKVRFPYIEGKRLDTVIEEAVKNKQWDIVFEQILLLKEIIMNVRGKVMFQSTSQFEEIFGEHSFVQYEAATNVSIDMVAANIIMADAIYIIDYEWTFDFPIPLKFILYRSILLNGTLNVIPQEKKQELFRLVDINEAECEMFFKMEIALQEHISGVTIGNLYPSMPTKNLIVNEDELRKSSYGCGVKWIEQDRKLFAGTYHISDMPCIVIDVKELPHQKLEVMLTDTQSIVKIQSVIGKKNQKEESLRFTHNANLEWNGDYFFKTDAVLQIMTEEYDEIEVKYRVLRVAPPLDDLVGVYVDRINLQNENRELKRHWLSWFFKKVKQKVLHR